MAARGLLAGLVLVLLTEVAAMAATMTWHVSLEGKDTWTGTLPRPNAAGAEGPVRSLVRARDLARQWRQTHPDLGDRATIEVHGGYHHLTAPLVLGPEDSGLTLAGAAGEKAVLGCGRALGGWRRLDDRLWAAPAPGTAEGKWDFRSLTVNGQWRRRSNLPQQGFFEHLSVYSEPWRSTTGGGFGKVPEELRQSMIYKPEDLGPWLSTKNAELVIYHSWDMSHARIVANDTKANVLTLEPLLGYPAGAFGIKKYRVENLKEGLHSPGLWYLDREAGQVVYWPLPGEDMARAEVMAPVGSALVKIEGQAGRPVRQVTLRNVALADTNVPWKSPGFGAAGISETAVSVNFGEECLLADLHFTALAGNAVKIWAGRGNRVSHCHLENIGASGLIAGGSADPGVGDDLTVDDNHLHHIGLVYPGGIAMRIGNVAGCKLRRNLIHDTTYSGICFSADKKDTPTNGLIENNHIFRVMTALNDGAAIYLGNRLDGTFVRGNVCHDIHGLTGQGWGIYPDEQSRFLTITGNLVYRCLGSFHCHMAHDLTIENNIGIFGDEYQVSLAKTTNVTLRRNIFYCKSEPIFLKWQDPLKDSVQAADHNLYFSTTGQRPALGKNTWEAWLAQGLDAHALFVDPLFVDPARDDFRLREDSPAYSLGFQPLDLSRVPPAQ